MNVQKFDNKNACILTFNDGTKVLQSYATPVAAIAPDGTSYQTDTKWSVTTSRQTNQFFSRFGHWTKGAIVTKPQDFFFSLVRDGKFPEELS